MEDLNLSTEERTIGAKIMKAVMKYSPKDNFSLDSKFLNEIYTFKSKEEYAIGKNQSFSVTYESESGKSITLSASTLKRSRYYTGKGVTGIKAYDKNKNIFLRSEAEAIWNDSVYFHNTLEMKKDIDFVIPERIKLRYAILSEDRNIPGEPLLNPFLFIGYKELVTLMAKSDDYPDMNRFREELLKTPAEGRHSFLPIKVQEPTKMAWVNKEVSDFRYNLVFVKV